MPTPPRASAAPLLERRHELGLASEVLDAAAAGRGSVLLIEGPAGIGKTELAREVARRAGGRGQRVCWARASDLERDLPYGVIRQLLEPLLAELGPEERKLLLQGRAAIAGRLLGEPAEGSHAAPDTRLSILHGLYWLISNLAEASPTALFVDDANWSDEASLAFVAYLARRVADLRVVVVLTVRRPEAAVEPQASTLLAISVEPATTTLRPETLGPAAVAELIRGGVGTEADERFCDACHRATGGNPFLVRELVQELRSEGIRPTADAAGVVERLAPEAVSRAVLLRISRLPERARHLARALSVLGDGAHTQDVAELAALDTGEANSAADELRAGGVIADSETLEFFHPLLREAVYADIPPGARATAHRRAAEILSRYGDRAATAAAHLLATGPGADDWIVETLRRAAAISLDRGEPASAARYLSRARDEPPADELRAEVLYELGMAQALAADRACTETLAQALAAGLDQRRRADVVLQLGRALWSFSGKPEAAADALTIDTRELDPDDELRVAAQRLERCLGWTDGLGGIRDRRESALAELRALELRARPPRAASAVLLAAMARAALERGAPAAQATHIAMESLEAGDDGFMFSSAIEVLIWGEAFEEAAAHLDRLVAEGQRQGSPYLYGVASLWRGVLRYRLGALADAEADCAACIDIMGPMSVDWITFPHAFLAEVLLERDLDAAARLLAACGPNRDGGFSEFYLEVRGRLHALENDPAAAAKDLRAAGERCAFQQSPGILAWRSNLAIALARLGEHAEALDLARTEVRLATDQGGSRALGVALRGLGLVAQGAAAIEHLESSAAVLESSPARLEHARTLIELGAALRRDGLRARAREVLRSGLSLAEQCGATVPAERALEELRIAGARPRGRALSGADSLTASERRVAQLAAGGASNRQIAQALFVSVWTVATHLTHIYRKLGIKGRDELGAGMEATDPGSMS